MNIKTWLQLFRISNLPTIVSNVLVGAALAGVSANISDLAPLLLSGLAITLIYLAGMVMNDILDIPIDRIKRPERPLVQDVISRGRAIGFCLAAFIFALIFLAISSGLALTCGLLLATCVIIYNFTHKQLAIAVFFMGLCRALIYPTVFAAVTATILDNSGLVFSISLGIYTLLLTMVARVENANRVGWLKWLAILMPLSILSASIFIQTESVPNTAIPAAILLAAWYIYAGYFVFTTEPDIKHAVCCWLAGFCLIDMFWLGLIGKLYWMPVAGICFVIALTSQRRIMGT